MRRFPKDLNNTARSAAVRSSVRQLQFDSLEDRRLLAGLNVFVFDDSNASGVQESNEQPLAGRVVFLDSNQNEKLDNDEPWQITNSLGRVDFANLSLGTYHVSMLGQNASQIQTTPTTPEISASITSLDGSYQTLGWKNESTIYVQQGQLIRQIDFRQQVELPSLLIPGSLIDIVADSSRQNATQSALAVIQRSNGSRELLAINLQTMTSRTIMESVGQDWQQVFVNDHGYYATRLNEGAQQVHSVDLTNRSHTTVVGATLPVGSQIFEFADSNRLLVEQTGSSNTLSVYTLEAGTLTSIAERNIEAQIDARDPNGRYVTIRNAEGQLEVLDADENLATVKTFDPSIRSIFFDEVRNQAMGLDALGSQWVAFNVAGSWSELSRITAPGLSAGTANQLRQVLMSPFRETMAAALPGGIYAWRLNTPTSAQAPFESNQQTLQVRFGMRATSPNLAPTTSMPTALAVNEDTSHRWTGAEWNDLVDDADGDVAYLLVTQAPQHGELEWSLGNGAVYTPSKDYEGSDVFVVQAFDGRSWSAPLSVSVDVAGINDAPTAIQTNIASIGEHATSVDSLGILSVTDPDADANYLITVSDSRFLVIDGVLKLAEGQLLDFEQQSSIPVEFVAQDQSHPENTISKSLILSLRDENDPVTGIQFELVEVQENQLGANIGAVQPIDQDLHDTYTWQISDPRFEVVEGQLRLKSDRSFDFESEPELQLQITVTDNGGSGVPVNQSLVVQIKDNNDPIEDIVVNGSIVLERVMGYVVGTVSVVDQDDAELFDFTVSDDRFVVEGGSLKLKAGQFVLASDSPTIPLEITATSRLNNDSKTKAKVLNVRANNLPWRNPVNPMDVNGDGVISPLDPLRIINHLNTAGVHRLDAPARGAEGEPGGDFIDVNGDGFVSPIDVLIVINELNLRGSQGGERDPNQGGGNQGQGNQGGDGGGEGEFVPQTQPAFATNASGPSIQTPVAQTNDLSLSEYLANQEDWFGPRRLNKRRS